MRWNEVIPEIGRCWSWFSAGPPAGYRPGLTLEQARRELGTVFRPARDSAGMLLQAGSDGEILAVQAAERVERHFLMHMVGIRLSMAVPAPPGPEAVIKVRNTGMLRRTGVACSSRTEDQGLRHVMRSIESDERVVAALKTLDFRLIRITRDGSGWEVVVEPFGACEVVARMPSYRRYVRLGSDQVKTLALVLLTLHRVIAQASI